MLTENIKIKLIADGFGDEIKRLEKHLIEYENRYIQKLVPQSSKPSRLVGQNGLHYIQLALYRSKLLIYGCISSMNSSNGMLGILSTRAHFEVTGAVAYFYKRLKSFYSSNITHEALDETLNRLTLGGRIKELERAPDPINVMSLIDAADEYFKKIKKNGVSMFRSSYDFLSEFCHPNYCGISIGADINKIGVVRYRDILELSKEDLVFFNYLLMSVNSFLLFYDLIFEMLRDNEELPQIIRKENC